MDATFHGGSNDIISGRGRLRRPKISRFIPFNFLLSLAAPHLHGVLVLVTGNKFIAGVVVTGDNSSLVLLSPATKLSPVSLSPATKLFAGVVVTGDKLFTGINDTGDH